MDGKKQRNIGCQSASFNTELVVVAEKSSECGDEELPLEEGGRERERASKRDRVILFNLLIEIADRFVLL